MVVVKRWLKWLWIILFKKRVNGNDLQNAWLIPCYNRSIEEIYTPDMSSREFFLSHRVSKRKHDLWRWWLRWALWRQNRKLYFDRRFPFVYIIGYSWKYIKGHDGFVYLNAAPTVKEEL